MSNSHILISESDPIIETLFQHWTQTNDDTFLSSSSYRKKGLRLVKDMVQDHLREYSFQELPLAINEDKRVLFKEITAWRLKEGF